MKYHLATYAFHVNYLHIGITRNYSELHGDPQLLIDPGLGLTSFIGEENEG